jgi:hypothetical protein
MRAACGGCVRLGDEDHDVGPGEGARYEEQSALLEVGVPVVVLHDVKRVALEGDQRVQGAEQLLNAAAGELLPPVGQIGLQQ